MNMRFTLSSIITVFAAIASLMISAVSCYSQQYNIILDSNPRRIAADGRATSQITATVTTLQGGAAPDGTEIRFTTTSGAIIPVARVIAGKATAVLTSGTNPNIAQVTATAGTGSAIAEVEFVSGSYQAKSISLTFDGELAYSIDTGILLGADSTVVHDDIRIAAETIEFDERRGEIRAQGTVTLSKGDINISSDALWYRPEDLAGALLIVGRANQQVGFRTDSLKLQDPQAVTNTKPFDTIEPGATRSWVIAERATIWPRERIQFTRAVVRVNDRPVLALPHYFYDYRASANNPIYQQFRYSAYEGIVCDLPFYFQFKKDRSANVRLRYAQKGSSYGGFVTPREGLSLGLEQTYDAPGGGGRVFLDAFTARSRSLEFMHNQSLKGRRVNVSIRYQPVSEYAKNSLSGNLSYAWSHRGLDFTSSVYGSRSSARGTTTSTGSRGSLTTRIDTRSRGQAIGRTGLSFRINAALVNGPVGSLGSGSLRTGFYQTAGLGLSMRPIPLVAGATLTLDNTLEQSFGASRTTSLRGRAALARPIGETGQISLVWDQEFAGGSALSSPYRKSLTGTLSLGKPDGLHGFAYASWLPSDDTKTFTASAAKPLDRLTSLELSHSFNGVNYIDAFGNRLASSFSYTRLSLRRQLGIIDLSLNWSPQGRDYGLKRSQKYWFEIGSRGF